MLWFGKGFGGQQMKGLRWILLTVGTLAGGCVTEPPPPIYYEAPLPITQAEKEAECSNIRIDISRVRALSENPPSYVRPPPGPFQTMDIAPLMQQRFRMQAAERIAQLENRASTIGCYSAFSDKPAPRSGLSSEGAGFDECFGKCKQHTQRTDERCFDSCKH